MNHIWLNCSTLGTISNGDGNPVPCLLMRVGHYSQGSSGFGFQGPFAVGLVIQTRKKKGFSLCPWGSFFVLLCIEEGYVFPAIRGWKVSASRSCANEVILCDSHVHLAQSSQLLDLPCISDLPRVVGKIFDGKSSKLCTVELSSVSACGSSAPGTVQNGQHARLQIR